MTIRLPEEIVTTITRETDSPLYVEKVADEYGVTAAIDGDGYLACARVLPGGVVLVLRAPVEGVAHV
jgi:hypothetical protein